MTSYETWMAAIGSSACIGFTSLVPWLFNMTFFERNKHEKEESSDKKEDSRMKLLLSFAVGSILGDIFFHLIPESLQSHIIELNDTETIAFQKVGLSILAGIFMFIIVEMILEKWSHSIANENGSTSDTILNIKKQEEEKIVILDCAQQISTFNKKDLNKPTIDRSGKFVNYDNSHEAIENNNGLMTDLNANINHHSGLKKTNKDIINNNNLDHHRTTTTTKNDKLLEFFQNNDCYEKKDYELTTGTILNGKLAHKSSSPSSPPSSASSSLNKTKEGVNGCKIIDVAGYLNLIANGFDNFTHGLAIGASFLVGPKVGLLTTFVIFIHEIPHEICDYAILVNSGFSRWDAVKAQSSVSLFGILGTATALYVKSIQTLNAKTVWILPFSAGGFLYIALVNLLPEILDQNSNSNNSMSQVACVISGIAFMGAVAIL